MQLRYLECLFGGDVDICMIPVISRALGLIPDQLFTSPLQLVDVQGSNMAAKHVVEERKANFRRADQCTCQPRFETCTSAVFSFSI